MTIQANVAKAIATSIIDHLAMVDTETGLLALQRAVGDFIAGRNLEPVGALEILRRGAEDQIKAVMKDRARG